MLAAEGGYLPNEKKMRKTEKALKRNSKSWYSKLLNSLTVTQTNNFKKLKSL